MDAIDDVGGSIWQFLFQEKIPSCLRNAVVNSF